MKRAAVIVMAVCLWLASASTAGAQRIEVSGSFGQSWHAEPLVAIGLFASVLDGQVVPLAVSEATFGRGRVWSSTVEVRGTRFISHGISYVASKAVYTMDLSSVFGDRDRAAAPLVVRSVSYGLTGHFLPPSSPVRPFAFGGPALVSLRFDSGLTTGDFSLPFQEIGVLARAYELGSIPPLEGGTLYKLGLRYGIGVKVRLSDRLIVRVDYSEVLTKQVDFLRRSTASFNEIGYIVVEDPQGIFRRGSGLAGVAFVF